MKVVMAGAKLTSPLEALARAHKVTLKAVDGGVEVVGDSTREFIRAAASPQVSEAPDATAVAVEARASEDIDKAAIALFGGEEFTKRPAHARGRLVMIAKGIAALLPELAPKTFAPHPEAFRFPSANPAGENAEAELPTPGKKAGRTVVAALRDNPTAHETLRAASEIENLYADVTRLTQELTKARDEIDPLKQMLTNAEGELLQAAQRREEWSTHLRQANEARSVTWEKIASLKTLSASSLTHAHKAGQAQALESALRALNELPLNKARAMIIDLLENLSGDD